MNATYDAAGKVSFARSPPSDESVSSNLHRSLPVLYLMLAFHAALLAPRGCWAQPVGMLLALLLTAGAISSVHSLSGLIGRRRQVSGSVMSVSSTADITTVTC